MLPHYGSSFLKLFPENVEAFTLGRHVFFRSKTPPDDLVAHELVHVAQYARLGIIPFLAIYCFDYLRGRLSGLDHQAAYRATRFEAEAYNKPRS